MDPVSRKWVCVYVAASRDPRKNRSGVSGAITGFATLQTSSRDLRVSTLPPRLLTLEAINVFGGLYLLLRECRVQAGLPTEACEFQGHSPGNGQRQREDQSVKDVIE
jgi:hypothetical protein